MSRRSLAVVFALLAASSASAQDRPAATAAVCTTCHADDLIRSQRLTVQGWTREIDKMIGWGAPVADAEKASMAELFATHYGVGQKPSMEAHAGEALLKARCMACHDDKLVVQQRLDAAGWGRELDKMIGWGASLNAEEKKTLADYLAKRFPVTPTR